ncbi:hypothetical protein ACRRTK_015957 [Alexandromys fortis]
MKGSENSEMEARVQTNKEPLTYLLPQMILDVYDGVFLRSGLNDGQWHEVRFLAKENFAVLTIDGDEASAVRTNSPLQVRTGEKYFLGGRKAMV